MPSRDNTHLSSTCHSTDATGYCHITTKWVALEGIRYHKGLKELWKWGFSDMVEVLLSPHLTPAPTLVFSHITAKKDPCSFYTLDKTWLSLTSGILSAQIKGDFWSSGRTKPPSIYTAMDKSKTWKPIHPLLCHHNTHNLTILSSWNHKN